jgi:branched-chain amino acid transport system permease protein
VSFGHAAFLGIGAYTVGILFQHEFEGRPIFGLPGSVEALVVWPLAMAVAAVFATVIGAICLRTRGVGFIMITLAFAQMLFYLAVSLRAYGGADGIALWGRSALPGLDLNDNVTFYYVVLALLVGFLLLGRRVMASRFGMTIRAAKDNEARLRALGVPVFRYRLVAFALSGAAGGLAGALLANSTQFVGPSYLAWHQSGELIVMVVMGGMGTLFGPVFGAAALLLLEEYLAELTEHWQIILGPLLLFIVLFARRGLYGLIFVTWPRPAAWGRRWRQLRRRVVLTGRRAGLWLRARRRGERLPGR